MKVILKFIKRSFFKKKIQALVVISVCLNGVNYALEPTIPLGKTENSVVSSPSKQKHKWLGGLVFAKNHNGHWENGFELGWTHPWLWSSKIRWYTGWTSNVLGSGMGSSKIFPKHNFYLTPLVHFRPQRLFDPYLGISMAYTKTFFDTTDPIERKFSQEYSQHPWGIVAQFGIKSNWHKIYGGPLVGIAYQLTESRGINYPLTSKLIWTFPLYPREL